MNLKDHILAAQDCPLAEVKVKEWDCSVYLRTWSGRERSLVSDLPRDDNFLARVLCLSLVDQDGKPLFDQGELDKLNSKSGAVLEKLALEALRHNGIGREAEAKN